MSERERIIYFILFFVITISLVCHLFFSWIGFNPTDDGFILSLSRRILDGEIPHKDFIYIRPALSPVIHIPAVYFGGELTFWFSRYFVWIELASTACIWTYIIAKVFFLIPFEKYLYFFLALTCFVFSAYTAFIMAHTAYDALFLYSLGLALCLRQSNNSILTGCFTIGLAYLCRQNFLFLVPITLIILGYRRKMRYWFAAVLPGILYVFIMLLLGSVNDLYFQIVSVSGKFHGGLKIFVTNIGFWLSIPAGYILMLKLFVRDNQDSPADKPKLRLFITLVLIITGILFLNSDIYPRFVSFCFFGLVFGVVLFLLRVRNYEYFKNGILILSVAWCTSISIGMSYPALLSGQLFLFTIILLTGLNKDDYFSLFTLNLKFKFIYFIVILLIVSGFAYARYVNVYRDKEALELNYNTGSVLQGTDRIYTNENTFEFLKDLQSAVLKAGKREYCILPDAACYWVKSDRKNPLPISWANKTEIGNEILFGKLISRLNSDDSLVVILEKVYANSLSKGFFPLPKDESYSPIVQYIVSNFRKYDETQYFELYVR